ncbi:hypothetical protein EVAR_2424_1 [Eumeta japonica]|uniref:Helitron helicase-like domain-containing protein n=1 Tax=Eumeta variegata TaxID=151549 RepID=A0A4C1SR26_EUMVA|nr:hypothetical protein EVAR_2424_1 [Eumeta japonica]
MYTIEWQKRGLPHVHLLVWLVNKIRPNQIDSVISAELPVKEEDPVLFKIVNKHMVHGPCGALNRNSPLHDRVPTIVHLAVHLENGQRVYFTEKNIQDVVNNPRDTTLTALFKLCAQDDFAKTLKYGRVPSDTWNQSSKTDETNGRKQGTAVDGFPGVKKTDALGRVYVIHPNNSECFRLRMLLHVVKGPTSFAHLRTVQGIIYNTYKTACKEMGLLEDDSHWKNTLSEAAIFSSAQVKSVK